MKNTVYTYAVRWKTLYIIHHRLIFVVSRKINQPSKFNEHLTDVNTDDAEEYSSRTTKGTFSLQRLDIASRLFSI